MMSSTTCALYTNYYLKLQPAEARVTWKWAEKRAFHRKVECWEKGRKVRRGFCFRLREAERAPNHCGPGGQRRTVLPEKPLMKWQQIQFLSISSFPECTLHIHLSVRPLCASNGGNKALHPHVFLSLSLQTMIDVWWSFHNSAIVCECSVKEQVFF